MGKLPPYDPTDYPLIYVVACKTEQRNIDGDKLGDSFSVERAFTSEKKAQKYCARCNIRAEKYGFDEYEVCRCELE